MSAANGVCGRAHPERVCTPYDARGGCLAGSRAKSRPRKSAEDLRHIHFSSHVLDVSCARNELSSNFKGSVVAGGSHRGPRLLPPPHGESGPLLKCSWNRFLPTRGGDLSPEGARKPLRGCEVSIPIRNVGATKKTAAQTDRY